ncbi:MAG: GatB/YqeY domain-containing protein [Paracoccaceae bacterium]
MPIRERLSEATKEAMKARDAARLSTLRMMSSAIKDRDIFVRGEGGAVPVADGDLMGLLAKMIKQRQDAARVYVQGGRQELADKELAEVRVIEEFLPRQMSGAEVEAAIAAAIAETGATGLKDMGRVMAALKAAYAGQMDFGAVGALIKARLG